MSTERRRIRGVHVTEHAIVRYLERHYNIDVKAILEEMVSPENAKLIQQFPNMRIGIKGDLWLNVKEGSVVTVEPSDLRHKPAADVRRNTGK
jgi:hypothetical protein